MTVDTAVDRVFNFSAGTAVLPLPVLEEAQRDLLSLPGCGASILEISHRSKPFLEILETRTHGNYSAVGGREQVTRRDHDDQTPETGKKLGRNPHFANSQCAPSFIPMIDPVAKHS